MWAWLAGEAALTNEALTVRAQTIIPTDLGNLYWPLFMPRVAVGTTRINEILNIDLRPVADRREWNATGRQIHTKTPDTRYLEMIPIESYFKIDEYETQRLLESVNGNQAMFRDIVGVRIPDRINALAAANWRRVEVDAMQAWSLGTITVRDPTGQAANKTVSLNIAAGRYTTAGTAWNNVGVNAYDLFITFMETAVDNIGPVSGAVMRLATFKEIQLDAPKGINNITLTRDEVRNRTSLDLGIPGFNFIIIEDSHDLYDDGGIAVTRTKVWPAQRVAAVPAGLVVGSTYDAPVARTYGLVAGAPNAGISVRGNSVFGVVANNGRDALWECQLNALSVPNEQLVYVINAGV